MVEIRKHRKQGGFSRIRAWAAALLACLFIIPAGAAVSRASDTDSPKETTDAGERYMREMEERYQSETGSATGGFADRSCENIRAFLAGVDSGTPMTLKIASGRLPGLTDNAAPENRVREFHTRGDGVIRHNGRPVTLDEFKRLSGMEERCGGQAR